MGSALFKPLNVFNGPTRVSTTLSMIFSALRFHNDARALMSRHFELDENDLPRLTLYRADAPYVETSLLFGFNAVCDSLAFGH